MQSALKKNNERRIHMGNYDENTDVGGPSVTHLQVSNISKAKEMLQLEFNGSKLYSNDKASMNFYNT